jgi:glutaminyl-tRNA synthetase
VLSDDTNPEAESQEYIDSLREDLHWMGWVPFRTTFTSDYFDVFYELALRLIRYCELPVFALIAHQALLSSREDKAYVCHQTKDDIARCREIARARLMDPEAPGAALLTMLHIFAFQKCAIR